MDKEDKPLGAEAQTRPAFQERNPTNDYEKASIRNEDTTADHTIPKDTLNGSASSSSIENETPLSTDDVPPPPDEPEATRTALQTFIIMASLCASVFLAALDMTIVTTALPSIAQHFDSSAGYTWIGSAYLLGNAASVPSWGKISDIWGRKPILLVAAAIFFVGSLLAGVSVSIGMLIAARAIQGVGSGGLISLVNISISDLFSMRNRGTYFGVIGMVWAFASSIGPILGGIFTSYASWRWCFYINCEFTHLFCCAAELTHYLVPITAVVFVLLYFFLHLHNPKTPVWEGLKAIDWVGSALVVGGTLMLLLGLEFGGVIYPWKSAVVICLIIFGILVCALFLINEWKFARYPVMPLRLFKHRNNIASLGVCFCHGYVFIAGTYYLPLYFQAVLGATPLQSGIYSKPLTLLSMKLEVVSGVETCILVDGTKTAPSVDAHSQTPVNTYTNTLAVIPFALSLSLVSGLTGVYIKLTGKYLPPIYAGLIVMLLGFGLNIDLPFDRNWKKIIIYQIVAGIGVGPNFQSPLIALQTMVKPRDIATATATFGFLRNLSSSISVVIGGVVFQNEMQKRHASLILSLGQKTADALSGGSAGASVDIVGQLPPQQREIARRAYWESLKIMWITYVAFALLGVFFSAFIGKQELSKLHQITKTGLAEEEIKRLEEVERKKAKREGVGSKEEV